MATPCRQAVAPVVGGEPSAYAFFSPSMSTRHTPTQLLTLWRAATMSHNPLLLLLREGRVPEHWQEALDAAARYCQIEEREEAWEAPRNACPAVPPVAHATSNEVPCLPFSVDRQSLLDMPYVVV